MREVSPGYLQHFIAYADTLSSLERLQQNLGALSTDADSGKPAPRTRARKRRSETLLSAVEMTSVAMKCPH